MESVGGVSPFAARKPESVQNLKFGPAETARISAVSMTRSVLSKKLSMREKQLESEQENQTQIVSRFHSMECLLGERDREVASLQKQLVAAVNRAQASENEVDRLGRLLKESQSTPPKAQRPSAPSTPQTTAATPTPPSIDLSEARRELKRTQEEAAATILALQGLSVAVDNCKDLDGKQKQLVQSLEKLLIVFQKAAGATGIQAAGQPAGGDAVNTEMLMARIRALEARNKELEVLFSSLQAIGRVTASEKHKVPSLSLSANNGTVAEKQVSKVPAVKQPVTNKKV